MFDRFIAQTRFGLGATAMEPIDDPQRWLLAQLSAFEPAPVTMAGLPGRAEIAGTLAETLETVRQLAGRRKPESNEMADMRKSMRAGARQSARSQYLALAGARFRTAVASPHSFVERLVHFWSNHFAVSADKLTTIGFAGLLEIEAIRPHVMGRFADMLIAVEQHPAMLLYLDQAQSVGPGSMLSQRVAARSEKQPGLNENLAREILELHTLGVRSGYDQADVTEFARALTGWSVAGVSRGPVARLLGGDAAPGSFRFVAAIHEPGSRILLGKRYAEAGESQARSILTDLARHPQTARHIATKLARHYVADDPPPRLVEALASVFLESDGDLSALYKALLAAPEAWQASQRKFKTPWEWSVSAFRALGIADVPDQAVVAMMNELGQPIWRPGSPAGFDDVAASWAGPDALMKRVDVAQRLVAGKRTDAVSLADAVMGSRLSADTRSVIATVSDRSHALALLLLAPEFLRR